MSFTEIKKQFDYDLITLSKSFLTEPIFDSDNLLALEDIDKSLEKIDKLLETSKKIADYGHDQLMFFKNECIYQSQRILINHVYFLKRNLLTFKSFVNHQENSMNPTNDVEKFSKTVTVLSKKLKLPEDHFLETEKLKELSKKLEKELKEQEKQKDALIEEQKEIQEISKNIDRRCSYFGIKYTFTPLDPFKPSLLREIDESLGEIDQLFEMSRKIDNYKQGILKLYQRWFIRKSNEVIDAQFDFLKTNVVSYQSLDPKKSPKQLNKVEIDFLVKFNEIAWSLSEKLKISEDHFLEAVVDGKLYAQEPIIPREENLIQLFQFDQT